jgi:hypothetical protein
MTDEYDSLYRYINQMNEKFNDEQIKEGFGMKQKSDGSTASYYILPPNTLQLQDLISHRNMNAQIGEIFRECYRYGMASHSDEMRGIKKILFYAQAELERLEKENKKAANIPHQIKWEGEKNVTSTL